MDIRIIQFAAVILSVFLLAGMGFAKSAKSTSKSSSKVLLSIHLPVLISLLATPARSAKSKKTAHGQRTIDEQRTREIQSALIREHYLDGAPTGAWNQETRDALVRYQAANGWQTKVTPDSRALIKLGLGPDHTGLLNPDTASIPSPHELGTDHETLPGGSAQQP